MKVTAAGQGRYSFDFAVIEREGQKILAATNADHDDVWWLVAVYEQDDGGEWHAVKAAGLDPSRADAEDWLATLDEERARDWFMATWIACFSDMPGFGAWMLTPLASYLSSQEFAEFIKQTGGD